MASANVYTLRLPNFDDDAFDGIVPSGHVRLYHYTDGKGVNGIVRSLRIRRSTAGRNTDAFFGEGTYLTDKSPNHHSKLAIAKDIWVNRDKLHDKLVKQGRTDYVFAIVIKRRLVQEKVSSLRIFKRFLHKMK